MAKTLSLNEIRQRCVQLVIDWRDEPGEEKQQAQSFVRHLLSAYGITGNKAALYEKRAKRTSTGRQGYIDALIPGLCVIEMKSRGKDLAQAEIQALDYIDDLAEIETPRWIITSDFFTFRILDLHATDGEDATEFTLEELPAKMEHLAFLAGYQQREFGSKEQELASIKAAQLMAGLYEELEGSGYDDHEASVFLVRTLFALYADDSGVWERDLFYEYLETRTSPDGSDLGGQLTMLYQALNKRPEHRQRNLDEMIQRFPYVNGGIFAEPLSIPAFDSGMRDKLLRACAFNWSDISPAIFGSLFQAVKDKKARRELGEHYTTETNILKTIGPLFLDQIKEQFAANAHNVSGLNKLRKTMGEMRFLDPACGCGNFLVVAYREMRTLDLQILQRLQELGDHTATAFFVKEDLPVRAEHFFGIEIEEWPARIATTALHLVDHQANQAMELALGMAPEPLPLGTVETIYVGNALRTDWLQIVPRSEQTIIMGNPPFLGHASRTEEQARELRDVWEREDIGRLDYVTGWYKKAIDFFGMMTKGRFAFVSTNSITQGEPVPALFGPIFAKGWRIRFAHQTFTWTSEAPGAAAVHCVIVGFDRNEKTAPQLFTYETVRSHAVAVPARNINGYLLDAPSVFVEQRRTILAADLPPAVFGSMPRDGGHLLVGVEEIDEVRQDPFAAKYLRKFVQAKELIRNEDRWCLWMTDLDPSDVSKSPILKERLEAVAKFRSESKAASTREMASTPYLFGQRSQPNVDYVCIPRHFSETRHFATVSHFGPEVICGDANFKAEDPDGFLFGVISSSMFLAWQKAVGGRIKSDLRFSNTLVWNTFPLPKLSEPQKQSIIDAGQQILAARALHPDRSLAEHYNPLAMSPEILKAHARLDRAVDKVFGSRTTLTTVQDRQQVLLRKYAELINSEMLPSK
ncbi:class I SAM-dependent DNA methyltransferase [Glutamicibacter protophormiae]|uniref:site-specific DNA-methyltransferase (adenine-specific) n=1 Tax=Glutamicibacter protophormiae TaxID=37930 RepID=A0ABS4XW73_GLUPR|nr:class I SAM-dependent DNA methyltransferase [Glutamicibacter protophormiae]MBP2400512.1 hypothetical protein [Glutamicibacter protophormiae]GGM01014.1 methylase [Glutamicibacter protophormiae]